MNFKQQLHESLKTMFRKYSGRQQKELVQKLDQKLSDAQIEATGKKLNILDDSSRAKWYDYLQRNPAKAYRYLDLNGRFSAAKYPEYVNHGLLGNKSKQVDESNSARMAVKKALDYTDKRASAERKYKIADDSQKDAEWGAHDMGVNYYRAIKHRLNRRYIQYNRAIDAANKIAKKDS